MKKFIRNFAMGVVLFSGMTITSANAQAVEEGKVLVDVYYGFPNLYTSVFKTAYANSGSESNVKVSGLGPLGVRGEYMMTDKIGLGLDIGFNSSKVSYQEAYSVYNSTTGSFNNVTYDYDFSTRKIGAIVTFNYHFLDNDNFDLYSIAGVGYTSRNFKFESSDPDYTPATVKSLIPVGFKVGVGMRYFFTDNLGAQLQAALGQGGILNAGISFKF